MKINQNEGFDTRQHILDSAFRSFAKYGFNRTAMSDIAAEAELSRTALYNHFKNKKLIFKAVCLRLNEKVMVDIQAAVEVPGVSLEKLQSVITARLGWVFELLHDSEHGRELIDEKNKICGEIGTEANQRFEKYVASLLKEAGRTGLLDLKTKKLKINIAASLLIDSAHGVVVQESDEEAARQKLSHLVAIFWNGLK